MLEKALKRILVGIAALIALAYTFGYNYLFKGIRETYLRGETGSTIDDGEYFPSHTIAKGQSIPWKKDSLYNKKALSNALAENLKQTRSASFLLIKNGKLLHEEYWDGYDPVSYTHLDVYKRQIFFSALSIIPI